MHYGVVCEQHLVHLVRVGLRSAPLRALRVAAPTTYDFAGLAFASCTAIAPVLWCRVGTPPPSAGCYAGAAHVAPLRGWERVLGGGL